MTTLSAPRRSYLSFSFRTLLIAMTLACFGAAYYLHWQQQERRAVIALRSMMIDSHYDHEHAALPTMELAHSKGPFASLFRKRTPTEPDAPKILRQVLGDDYFQSVTAVSIVTNDVNEIKAALPHLKRLRNLREVLLHSPSCIMGSTYGQAEALLLKELPQVKVTSFGSLPIVG
ncbi:hypothetical protein [Anatilimnocola floriformis]|uniref:hypothetical protein n=1 Tax=Anatilimnocola floriformis TaxID=2948575 RepID=UPI0020C562F4|nr:hypothetical protein [Anatilimnocola floriformis]